jgi:hypothetical protein
MFSAKYIKCAWLIISNFVSKNIMAPKKATKAKDLSGKGEQEKEFPGYPPYPVSEDIYYKFKEESEIDPEDPNQLKPLENPGIKNEKDFEEDVSGSDLDVPGAELDDLAESVGSEDEENNYYSLGGDNHENQEEYKGE